MEMLSLVILSITTTLLAIFLILWIQNSSKYPKKHLPPQAAGGWPIIGHLSLLSGPQPPHISLSNMAEKYGPIFNIRLGLKRAIIVSSSEIARECFTSLNDVCFSNRPQTAAIEHMGYNFAMFGFSKYGPYWREMRKIVMQKLLSNKRVAVCGSLHEAELRSMMISLYKSCADYNGEKGGVVEMTKWFGDLTLNMIVRLVGGDILKNRFVSGESEKLHERIKEFLRLMGDITLSDVIPFLKWVDCCFEGAKIDEFKKNRQGMDEMLQSWLDYHKNNGCDFGLEKEECLMEQLLGAAVSVAQDFPRFNADVINKATCKGVILGGGGTMTVSLTWALSLLLNNRHTLKQAQHELDMIIGKERHVRESDIENLPYIQAIIKETLRLYPPSALSPARVTLEDCTLAGYHVPAGSWLIVNVWKLQHDPRIWNDALEFIPERFLTEKKEVDVRGQHFDLLPFGAGRRICPAVTMSVQIMGLVLASLLHEFDIGTQFDEAVDMTESSGSSNKKVTPLDVLLKPRLSLDMYA